MSTYSITKRGPSTFRIRIEGERVFAIAPPSVIEVPPPMPTLRRR
jgi:hypothetical protein